MRQIKQKNTKYGAKRGAGGARRAAGRLLRVSVLAGLILIAALNTGLVPESIAQRVPAFLRGTSSYFSKPYTDADAVFDLSDIPAWNGSPSVDVNGDVPFFTEADMTAEPFERYGELDALGRCTAAFACVGPETLPDAEREDISAVRPSGWRVVPSGAIDGGYLYNRCHLIGFQLTGENANERNLITGTRYLNILGMQPFENSVGQYVRETGHHVLYRVTPVFEGRNLVASGVLMEARSVENPVICFCAYCYNVQPGVTIDYATGNAEIS